MSESRLLLGDRAAALRDAFDRVFAEPHPPDPPPREDLLAIRVATEPYALRLSEIAGLFADRKVIPVPGQVPTLLGLAGFRGAIIPVYDLSALLGHRSPATTRWLALAAKAPVAFAFEALAGHLRVPLTQIVPQQADERPRRHVRDFARLPDWVRPIVDLSTVLDAVSRQIQANLGARSVE
jgi:chemotaxis signal transduction protein